MALGQVTVWEYRGSVPHAVASTAALTDALLTDAFAHAHTLDCAKAKSAGLTTDSIASPDQAPTTDAQPSPSRPPPSAGPAPLVISPPPPLISTRTLRGAYCTAISHFVTGLADTQQTRLHKKTMLAAAREIGLPAAFIEVRHWIAHEGVPPLEVLRNNAEEALQWLWKGFWRDLGGGAAEEESERSDDEEDRLFPGRRDEEREELRLRRRLRAVLMGFLARVQAEAEAELRGAKGKKRLRELDASAALAELCDSDVNRLQVLSDVLLTADFLLPAASA